MRKVVTETPGTITLDDVNETGKPLTKNQIKSDIEDIFATLSSNGEDIDYFTIMKELRKLGAPYTDVQTVDVKRICLMLQEENKVDDA